MIHRKHLVLALLMLVASITVHASGLAYRAMLRNDEGKVLSGVFAKITASVLNGENQVIYSEVQEVVSGKDGYISIRVGEGLSQMGDYDAIQWKDAMWLKVTASYNDKENLLSLSNIAHVPSSLYSNTTEKVRTKGADGKTYELAVRLTGDLYWKEVPNDDPQPPYPEDKWPENLYLVGSFCNWDPAKAVQFQCISKGVFSLHYNFSRGAIFKFIQQRNWYAMDWSATACTLGQVAPLQEYGDTPAISESGMFDLTVDFTTFTFLITKMG